MLSFDLLILYLIISALHGVFIFPLADYIREERWKKGESYLSNTKMTIILSIASLLWPIMIITFLYVWISALGYKK